jgi:tetratricopeptide (TPR) repeat protein
MERWPDSLAAADAALVREPNSTAALKLRAEVLSWSGRYRDALVAYDVYLAAQPRDVEARRQQARVAGWAGWSGESKRLYGTLQTAFPNDASLAAEIAAKTAFFDGRWRAAADAYDRWIALDPDNGEARFERAEALRANGQVREADAALASLASASNQRLAESALDRATATRRPSASLIADQRSSNGYAGRRLLDLGTQGAAFAATFGASGRTTINADAAHVSAAGGDAVRQGARVGVTSTTAASTTVQLDTRVVFWNFSDGGIPDLQVRAAWRPADRWTIGAGANREPIFENVTTIDRRIGAAGVFADAAFESPRTTMNAQVSRQALTDGNARTRATVSISQSVSDRLKQVRIVGWAESLAYRASAADYYAPARHLRLDAGLEYAHAFSTPKFRGDREQSLAFGYLVGTDEDGVVYQHPSLRLTLEFARGLAIDARANWIRSTVYNETSAYVGIRIGQKAEGKSQK